MDTTSLVIGIISGAFGCAYFVYGIRQKKIVPLFSGLVLSIIPYFIENAVISGVVCLTLIIIPFIIKTD